jgi:hypothetical protein
MLIWFSRIRGKTPLPKLFMFVTGMTKNGVCCAASIGLLLRMSGVTRRLLPIPFEVIQRSYMFTSQLGPTLRQTLTLLLRSSSNACLH